MKDAGILFISLLGSTLRVSTPLLFASLGGLLSERAGVVNIALEGMMLVGAFSAGAVAAYTHSPWTALLAGGMAGALLALLYGVSVISLRADQIVAGTAINFLAMGLVPFACKILFHVTGSTPNLALADRFSFEPILLSFFAAFLVQLWMKHTRSGLWVMFAGEHPQALEAAGIRPRAVRYWAVVAGGILAGIGGASLSIFLASAYSRNMTAGRGFMALAALILGKWKPMPTLGACLVFGFFDAVQIRLQGLSFFGDRQVPVQFIQILPYVLTLLVLTGWVGSSRPPKNLGIPY